jgi:hypothetical protein
LGPGRREKSAIARLLEGFATGLGDGRRAGVGTVGAVHAAGPAHVADPAYTVNTALSTYIYQLDVNMIHHNLKNELPPNG